MERFERWLEVKRIFEEALEIPPEERAAFLDRACPGDEELRREIDALLNAPPVPTSSLAGLLGLPERREEPDYAEGDTIDHFTIVRCLGKGGMGVVYEARDARNNNRPVALKVLLSRAVKLSQDKRIAGFADPSIVTFHDSGETSEGLPYFVFEYIEGEPITVFCERRNLVLPGRLRLFQKVCEALVYAHQRLVIHCDLKPENILVTATGALKLLDFGIAKQVGEEITSRDFSPMTLPFASPEQAGGEETTTLSDVYSLGVLLSVLLSGCLPYRATNSISDLRETILHEKPILPSEMVQFYESGSCGRLCSPPPEKKPSRLARALRGDLDAIVSKALCKDPKERYSSVQELSDDIRSYLEDKPAAARAGGWRYHVGKFVVRHRIGTIFTSISLLGVIAFSAALGHQYSLTLRERDAARAAAVRSEQLSTFLTSMFDLGDPFRHLGTPPTLNELLAQSVRQLRSGRFNLAADKALFSETLARIYSAQGDFKMSLSLYQDALDATQSQAMLPKDAARKARIVTQIADTRIDLGQLPEARQDLGRAHSLQRAVPAIPPIDLARWLITSARERVVSGGFHEAIDLYDKALSLTANLPDAQGTAASICQERSLPLLFVGRTNDALDSSNKAIGIGQRLYHKEHPALASMVMTRATILGSLGRYQNAAQDLQQAEDALKSTFGADHPVLSDVLEDRGGLAIEQQHFDQATDLFRQSFELRNRKLGPAHMETLRAYQKIGEAIQGKGDLPSAETMLRKALNDFERFGYDNVYSIGDLLNNLGLLLLQRGNLTESQPLLERALRVREQMHGPKSAWVAVTRANLSNLYSQQGQRVRARRELLEAIDIMKASFGPQHYLVAIGLNNLGTMYKTSQDYGPAAKLYREALAILKKSDLGDSLLASYPMTNLSEVLLETGQLEEAHEHIRRVQDILRTQSDPALPLRDEADGIEGTYLLLRGQFPEAEAKMKSSYEGLRQKTGLRSKQTQAALARLVRLYDSWGKHDLAAKYRKLGS